jgi:hypothetical protein
MRPLWIGCVLAFCGISGLVCGPGLTRADKPGPVSAEESRVDGSPRAEGEAVVNCDCAAGNEVMTDRCSAAVAIVPSYDARPDAPGTVVLVRDKNGQTDWTPPFTVRLGPSGHIRWWCNSTTGNWADPGTWRVKGAGIGVKQDEKGDLQPTVSIQLTDSSWKGWTPERSRCDNRSTKIRARLGPDRLLQIECLGK